MWFSMNSPLVSQPRGREEGRGGVGWVGCRQAEPGETLVFFLLLLYAVGPAKQDDPYELRSFRITELVARCFLLSCVLRL